MSSPLTILQLLPRLDTGGAERTVLEIAEAIQSSGHICLIAAEPGGPLDHIIPRTGATFIPLPLASKSPLTLRANAGRLQKLIAERHISLVHAHSRAPAWSARWATQRTQTPFVTTYHGAYSEKNPVKHRYNAVMASADRVIAVSAFIANLIRTRYATPEAKLRTILGGVDPEKFNPASVLGDRISRLAKEWRLDVGAPTILLPGRLTGWKGQKLLITALAKLRHSDAIAILAGSDQGRDNYRANLITLAKSLGVENRLRLAGHTEDMPAAMMLADIVVNCSTDPEAFGRTIIEAQSMSRIVIAANHGGARETILPNETGFLFPPGDTAALAAAIDTALDMPPDTRIAWGQQARAHVTAHHSIAAMQHAVLNVYAELLA